MFGLVLFFLFSFILFLIFSNFKYVKTFNAAERNLKYIEEKKSYDTVDEHILKEDFNIRMKKFFRQQVDRYVITNTKEDKIDRISKMLYKVYKGKKTYAEWEYERTLVAVAWFALGMFGFLLLKNPLIPLFSILLVIFVYQSYESNLKSKSKNIDWMNFIFFPDMLMSLCMLYRVGAVSGVFQGFKKLCKIYDHPLIDEIKKASKEHDFNKDKYEVLQDLSDNVDFKEFTSFINIVMESEKNNIPIVENLTEYAFEISSKRKILATNQILKLPEKIEMVMLMTSMPICFIYMILPSLTMALGQMSTTGI